MYRVTNHTTGGILERPYWGEDIQLAVDYAMSEYHKITCEWVEEEPLTTIQLICPNCGKRYCITVPNTCLIAWQNGELIQNAMANVSPEIRESFITDLCEECQL